VRRRRPHRDGRHRLTADAGEPSIATTVRANQADGGQFGIVITGDNVSAWLTRNSAFGSQVGIYVDSGRGNQITYNNAGGLVHDCQDLTVGVDGNPLNQWYNNTGGDNNSSPANICTYP
jgi:parallel beta-helix repeat protein